MSIALAVPFHRMTVAEFLDWDSGDRTGARWQLRDGEPEMMAPASDPHGSIHGMLAHLLIAHFDAIGRACRVVIAPGVVPGHRSEDNCRVPDIGVTCAPPTGARLMETPALLVEILSPSNVSKTRANVRAHRTIPTVTEIVVLHSTAVAAEVLRRASDAAWPRQPALIDAGGILRLDSIGFAAPLRDVSRTSGLV
jgi:Uma2 family endonuclease